MLKDRIIAEPFKDEEGYIEADQSEKIKEFEESEPEEIEADQSEKEGLFKIKDKPIFILPMDMKKVGRVGLSEGGADFGGIPAAIQNIKADEEEMITIMTDNGPIEIQKSVYESMPAMFMDTTTSAYGDAGKGRPVPKFAEGGIVPGVGNSDPVPAMLTPGELILNQAQQENVAQGLGGGINIEINAPLVDETVIDTIIPAIQKAQKLNLA